MTPSSKHLVDNRIDRKVLAAERDALVRDLLEGEGVDQEIVPRTMFTAPVRVNGATMEYGAENGFKIKTPRWVAAPVAPFDPRTVRFFRLVHQTGLLQPALMLWRWLGEPTADKASDEWRRFTRWFTKVMSRRQVPALAAGT